MFLPAASIRIARSVRPLWSATPWAQRDEVRAPKPGRLRGNRVTDFQLPLRLIAAEDPMAALEKPHRSGPPNPECGSESTRSHRNRNVPSQTEVNLLGRGPSWWQGCSWRFSFGLVVGRAQYEENHQSRNLTSNQRYPSLRRHPHHNDKTRPGRADGRCRPSSHRKARIGSAHCTLHRSAF